MNDISHDMSRMINAKSCASHAAVQPEIKDSGCGASTNDAVDFKQMLDEISKPAPAEAKNLKPCSAQESGVSDFLNQPFDQQSVAQAEEGAQDGDSRRAARADGSSAAEVAGNLRRQNRDSIAGAAQVSSAQLPVQTQQPQSIGTSESKTQESSKIASTLSMNTQTPAARMQSQIETPQPTNIDSSMSAALPASNGQYSERPFEKDIKIHTLANSNISRQDFDQNTRWYQEEGNTQKFRLYDGDVNTRNSRPNSARIEAFSSATKFGEGEMREWSSEVTIVKPQGASIFQSKNNVNQWSVMINMSDNGDIKLNRRVGEDEIIAKDMVGKPFDLRVRDDGRNYEVFLNDKSVGTGSFDRPQGETMFRWGMYVGEKKQSDDAEIHFTGTQIS